MTKKSKRNTYKVKPYSKRNPYKVEPYRVMDDKLKCEEVGIPTVDGYAIYAPYPVNVILFTVIDKMSRQANLRLHLSDDNYYYHLDVQDKNPEELLRCALVLIHKELDKIEAQKTLDSKDKI